ncbi:MAG TPA: DUF1800 domain-containing protein, partial [Chloroflexota bacterium]
IDVSHLLRRAGFGASPDHILAAAKDGAAATANKLIAYDQIPEQVPPPPASITDPKSRQSQDLGAWWLGYMLTTQRPLQEKLTLFWHGHFATALSKVASPAHMYAQNQTFRANALGRFDDLLTAVYKDPAMLIWLDGQRNISTAPNENWGREVMELFTVGRGNYTEDDVHACARAFTGWRIDANGQSVFVPRLHDNGSKTLLGQTGNWTSDDAVRILAAHPATGPFLATRLWRFFASETPPAAAIDALAQTYNDSGHSIRAMITQLFTMPAFYSASVHMNHIKSPVEFTVTAIRELGLQNVDVSTFPRTLALLGQELFNPPNVGGWPGGANWISAATMLGRFNFASRLTGDIGSPKPVVDGDAILQASGADTAEQLMFFVTNTLGLRLSAATSRAMTTYLGRGGVDRIDAGRVQGLVHLALASPEYQMS